VQFDPDAFHRTLDMITGYQPEAVYVTHYSQLQDVVRLAADMHRLVDAFAAIGLRHAAPGPSRQAALGEAMSALALEEGRRQGWRGDEKTWGRLLGPDLELNAQGLVSWLDSRAR
jgi:hydroxyacylglutathione hydrolase